MSPQTPKPLPDVGRSQSPTHTPKLAGVPDPDCRYCHGEGSFFEDVVGDGGPRMQVPCDCIGEGEVEMRTITIPAHAEHAGFHSLTVSVPWLCLECGAKRGEPFETLSYDGSRRLNVTGWRNECGHVEKYSDVRAELRRIEGEPRP